MLLASPLFAQDKQTKYAMKTLGVKDSSYVANIGWHFTKFPEGKFG